jgi:hypothetical protein
VPHITPMFHATGWLLSLAVLEVAGCYGLVAALLYRRRRWYAVSIFVLLTAGFAAIYRFGLPIPIANVILGPIVVTAMLRVKRLRIPPIRDYRTEAMRPLL